MYCDAPIQEGGTRKNFSVVISDFVHSAFSCSVCRTCLQVGQRGVLITMLQRDLKISVLCALFLVYRLSGGNTDGCNYTLVFPTLNHSLVLTAEENANVVLPFQLDLEPACAVPDDLEIEVYKSASTDGRGIRGMICSFTHVNGVCHATKSSSCICGLRNGTFEFRRTVQLADNATWIWQTDWGGIQRETEVVFNIIRKPRATQPKATKSSFTSRNPMKAPAAAGTTDDPATDDASSPQNDSNGVAIALVLGTVGIIAVAAAATVIIRMFLNRSRRNHHAQPELGDQDRQRKNSPEASQYHLYMEVPDDPPSDDAGAPEELCEAPKPPPDDYLLPVPSDAVAGSAVREHVPLPKHSH